MGMLDSNSIGRPPLSDNEIDIIFRKLEPYLKSGLNLHKACIAAQIPKSTVYDLGRENREFAERIESCMNYFSVLVNGVISKELMRISEKQKSKELNTEELRFIQWLAVNSKSTKDEFDRKFIPVMDKEASESKQQQAILDNPKAVGVMIKLAEKFKQKMIEQGKYSPEDKPLNS